VGKDADAQLRDEGFFAPILTPLVTGAIGAGLKAAGARLKEIAEEKQVDVLHTGDYLYQPVGTQKDGQPDVDTSNDIELRSHCMLITTRGTMATKGTIADLVGGYDAAKIEIVGASGDRRISGWNDSAKALASVLTRIGYTDNAKPAIVLVVDIELGTVAGAARFVPRFIVLDHSIREQKVDSTARDFTFEIALQGVAEKEPFAEVVLKFEAMKTRVPRKRVALVSGMIDATTPSATHPLGVTSAWFALPPLDADSKARATATAEADKTIKTALESASLAGAEALAAAPAGAHDIPTNANLPECPNLDESKKSRLLAAQALQRATLEPKKDEALIAYRTKVLSFFDACTKLNDAAETKAAKRFRRRSEDGTPAETLLAYDANVHVKEFRERPAAEFFGNLLSDTTTSTALTTALVNAVDPGTRAAIDAAEEAADLKARADFEAALIAAETAILAYSTAKEEEKALKLIDMEAKKRTANRLAESNDFPMPYPASGTWLSLSG
jgi:hypothetical protein